MLLIGSRALAYWDETFKVKEDADWDIICKDEDEVKGLRAQGLRVEVHKYDDLNNSLIYDSCVIKSTNTLGRTLGLRLEVADLNTLALIKRSHLWRDYQWDKHITHYHKHLKPHLLHSDLPHVKERARFTKEKYPQGQPSLNQTNEDFFDDAVAKVYDHDWLHELAAYYDSPLYTRLKRDDSKAWCEKDLWDQLLPEDKAKCIAEEAYVIATERYLVRTNWEFSYRGAYLSALKKICTTLTSGWFRDYAIDSYPEIVSLFDVQKIQSMKGKINA
jgi:hypothetical protein